MTKWDKILIACVLLFSIGGMVFVSALGTNSDQKYITINIDGKQVKKISMELSKEGRIYEFAFNDQTGFIEVKDGEVRMLEMPKEICPQKICSDTGWISKPYQSIVCLPNRIVVQIEQKSEMELDTISY
ncbi:MAG: NusG domain II-containing protein [Bacillota bacterium]